MFVPLDPMHIFSVTLFSFLQAMPVRMLESQRGKFWATSSFRRWTQFIPLFYRSWPPTSDAVNHYAPLPACRSKVSMMSGYSQLMFSSPPAQRKIPDRGSEHSSQKMFIRTNKINEIMNDSDSDGGIFCEISDSDMCKVLSPFSSSSSSEEEEVVQPEPCRGRKRTCRALPKRANTNFELGWKEQIQSVQKPVFSGVQGINKNFYITQDSSPWDIFKIFFSP